MSWCGVTDEWVEDRAEVNTTAIQSGQRETCVHPHTRTRTREHANTHVMSRPLTQAVFEGGFNHGDTHL